MGQGMSSGVPASIVVEADGTDLAGVAQAANSPTSVTFPAVAGKTNYLTGFTASFVGSTAGGYTNVGISGLLGGTLTYFMKVPATATADANGIAVQFTRPIPASGQNVAITISLGAVGTGSPFQSVSMQGFYK